MELVELILRATQGDADALERLLRRYQQWIRGLVVKKASPQLLRFADANEIAQRAMTECFRSIKDLRLDKGPQASFEAWLSTVTRHAVVYFGRKRKRAMLQWESDLIGDLPAKGPTASKLQRSKERGERLNQAIQQLPEVTQKMIEKSMKGWTHQEIADEFGMSKSAVNSRLERARQRLREILGSTSMNLSSQ